MCKPANTAENVPAAKLCPYCHTAILTGDRTAPYDGRRYHTPCLSVKLGYANADGTDAGPGHGMYPEYSGPTSRDVTG